MKTFKEYITESKGIGKEIGGSVYLHKDYLENHPRINQDVLNNAKEVLKKNHPDHKYNIVRYGYQGKDKDSVSFTHSPDFDTSHEPISGNTVRVNSDNSIKVTKQKSDPQIYHHKHQFVGNDYKGFDIEQSKKRSSDWSKVTDKIKSERPEEKVMIKIGTKSYWENNIVSKLN